MGGWGLGGGGGEYIALTWSELYIYKYTCQRDICFLVSKLNNQLHLISNLSHVMWTSSQVQRDTRKTHLNHWPKNLINKYIHYKSNVLSTFSWLEPVLTPALDIGIAKSNLVHRPSSHILCLMPCVKTRKRKKSLCLTLSCDDVPSN